MRDAFASRFSPERTSDDNLTQNRPILNLILAACCRLRLGIPETKPGLTGQDIKKLVIADSQTTWWCGAECNRNRRYGLDGGKHD